MTHCKNCLRWVEPERVEWSLMPACWICTFCGVWLDYDEQETA